MHDDPVLHFEGDEVATWDRIEPAEQQALADWIHAPWTRHERDARLARLRQALRFGDSVVYDFLHASGLRGGGGLRHA